MYFVYDRERVADALGQQRYAKIYITVQGGV